MVTIALRFQYEFTDENDHHIIKGRRCTEPERCLRKECTQICESKGLRSNKSSLTHQTEVIVKLARGNVGIESVLRARRIRDSESACEGMKFKRKKW